MTSVADVTRRALRVLSVLDASESPTAEDSDAAIEALNGMLRRWEANGLALGWTPVANPTDMLTTPDEATDAIVYGLAIRLSPEYSVQPSQVVATLAGSTLNELRRDRMVEMPLRQSTDAPMGFRTGKYDTLTDTWRR